MKRLLIAALLCCACHSPTLRVSALPSGCSAWPALPMTVHLDEEAHDYAPAFTWAAAQWTRALGRPAFVLTKDADADAFVVTGEYTPGVGADTSYDCTDGRVTVVVVMHDPYAVGDGEQLALHELGHVLGLWHSGVEASIMYWHVRTTRDEPAGPDVEWPPPFPQAIRSTDARVANALHSDGALHP